MGPVAFLICISDEVNAPFDGSKIGVGAVTGCEGGEVTYQSARCHLRRVAAVPDGSCGHNCWYTTRASGRVMTVSITAMTFHCPAMVGDEVTCFCNVERIGKTSYRLRLIDSALGRPRASRCRPCSRSLADSVPAIAIDQANLARPASWKSRGASVKPATETVLDFGPRTRGTAKRDRE